MTERCLTLCERLLLARPWHSLLVMLGLLLIVGAHMVGPDAPEIIQGLAIVVKAGLTKEQFDATVAVHPTAAEEFVTLRDKRAARR